jgi:predicted Fe-Mo cluster-binding NifX family protein
METNYFVVFDTRSGKIMSVHHGSVDALQVREQCVHHHPDINDKHIDVIAVSYESVEQGKQYKVDIGNKVLVAAMTDEDGVGFGFGGTVSAIL